MPLVQEIAVLAREVAEVLGELELELRLQLVLWVQAQWMWFFPLAGFSSASPGQGGRPPVFCRRWPEEAMESLLVARCSLRVPVT